MRFLSQTLWPSVNEQKGIANARVILRLVADVARSYMDCIWRDVFFSRYFSHVVFGEKRSDLDGEEEKIRDRERERKKGDQKKMNSVKRQIQRE